MKSDSKFAIYDGHSSFRGEVEYLGEIIIVKVFETTLGDIELPFLMQAFWLSFQVKLLL